MLKTQLKLLFKTRQSNLTTEQLHFLANAPLSITSAYFKGRASKIITKLNHLERKIGKMKYQKSINKNIKRFELIELDMDKFIDELIRGKK